MYMYNYYSSGISRSVGVFKHVLFQWVQVASCKMILLISEKFSKLVDKENLHGFGGFPDFFWPTGHPISEPNRNHRSLAGFFELSKNGSPEVCYLGGRGIHPPWRPAKAGESKVTLLETNIPPLKKIDPGSRGDSELGNPCIFRGYKC